MILEYSGNYNPSSESEKVRRQEDAPTVVEEHCTDQSSKLEM